MTCVLWARLLGLAHILPTETSSRTEGTRSLLWKLPGVEESMRCGGGCGGRSARPLRPHHEQAGESREIGARKALT